MIEDPASVPSAQAEQSQIPSLLQASAPEFHPPSDAPTPETQAVATADAKVKPEAETGWMEKVTSFFGNFLKAGHPSSDAKAGTPRLTATEDSEEATEKEEAFVWKKRAAREELQAEIEKASSTALQAQQTKMDKILMDCFLQAVKTRVKDRDLPIMGTTLYGKHMRAISRGRGISCDVKDSSYLWLRPFLDALENDGLLKLKPGQKDPMLVWINRDHPSVTQSKKTR